MESGSPIDVLLAAIHAEIATITDGAPADYIPELGKADPSWFGIAMATTDGQVYGIGDVEQPFTIQSVSKPFMYGSALREHGQDYVLARVGVEPTGEAFNSILLDAKNNRPFNPMVNAGAIAVAGLMQGESREARRANMLGLFGQFAGRPVAIDEAVFRSEDATGHRNRAIAYMMLNSGMIRDDVPEILDLYFRQCSVLVTAQDLALMAATLANDGVHPKTGERVLEPGHVRDVLTVMSTCGMYDYAGQWAFEVGMPAKSGVSGAIIAVIPGQVGIGVFSPPVDSYGNSVRGVRVCQRLSREFGLHFYASRPEALEVVRREFRGDLVHSKRLRTPREIATLERRGQAMVVLELQGPLYFGSGERLIRRLAALDDARFLILDFKRVHSADAAAVRLVRQICQDVAGHGQRVLMTHVGPGSPLSGLYAEMSRVGAGEVIDLFPDTDHALEWCEERILAEEPDLQDRSKLGLAQLDVFRGLGRDALRSLEQVVQPMHFEAGDTIIRAGDPAQLLFVVARGSVTVSMPAPGEKRRRIACMGPGMSFGEMALLDGGVRSADVTADERVICYGFSVEALHELSAEHPTILVTILGNMIRDFSDRLRRANREMAALD